MKLYIRNMVCARCIMVVREELDKLNIIHGHIELGEVNIIGLVSQEKIELLRIALYRKGLQLIDNKKSVLIQKIKTTIIELIHYSEEPLVLNFSTFLSDKLHYDYTYLANLFSETEGITIQNFVITHKIERVKELLLYNELNLTEISYLMHYSSVAHLSAQFKKITGLTPTHFKSLNEKRQLMLDGI